MPRSPWLASAGCTNCAGVPVLAKVAAILRAIWPDLPMPETITRPLAASSRSTAPAKLSPSASASSVQRLGLAPDHAAAGGQKISGGRCHCVSSQPRRSSSARVGRKSKQRCARSSRSSRISRASSSAFSWCRYSTSDAAYSFCASVRTSDPQSLVCCCLETSTPTRSASRYFSPCRSVKVRISFDAILVHQTGAVVTPKALLQRRNVEAAKVEQLQHCRIGQQPLQVRRAGLAAGDLHQMRIAVAVRQLHHAQPVAARVKPHRFGVDGDDRAKGQAVGQVVLVQMNGQGIAFGKRVWFRLRLPPCLVNQSKPRHRSAGPRPLRPDQTGSAIKPTEWAT